MKCDCLKDIEKKLADYMVSQAGAGCTASASNTVFMLDGGSKVGDSSGLSHTLQIPYRVKGTKKGYTSEKGKEIGVNVSCCPFCGRNAKRYVVGQDAALAAAFNI